MGAADILVSNRTTLLVYLNLGLNICSSLQSAKSEILFLNQPLIGETKISYTPHRLRYLDYRVFRAHC